MPNRIIKESTFGSEKIAELSDFEFRLWVGLITQADDAGRGDARPAIIKGRVFPLRDRVTAKDIDTALHGLAAKGCVSLYMVGGKPYFWFPTWAAHQRVRECKPKYPGPEEADNPPQAAASCGEAPQSAALIQSESNPNPNPNPSDSARRFTPPTVEQVAAYVRERRSPVDPQEFVDFYASKGWMVGKTPMKDWKAACRNAEKWDRWNKAQPQQHPSASPDPKALERVRKLYGKVSGNGP